jgi:ArsR family transcriptional regulator, virulence genes transcriptional regulator
MSETRGMDEVYRLQAEVLRALSNPNRLEIVHLLAEGPCEVGRLAQEMGLTQPNVSQHLAVMRAIGIVESERDGREVRYRLSDPEIICACETMRGVLLRRIARMAALAGQVDLAPSGADDSVGTVSVTSPG